MSESKKFTFDVGITFIASVINMLFGFIITILLGRYLGSDDLGLYRMTFTIYGIALVFAGIGIPAAMIKYVAEFKSDSNKINSIVSSGVITSLILGIGSCLLLYFLSGIFEEIFDMYGLSGLLRLLSPVFPFALIGGALLGLLNGFREMKKYSIAIIIQSALMLITSVILIYFGFGVNGVIVGIVLSSVGSCLYLIWVTSNFFKIALKGYVLTTKKLLRFGVQIFIANSINLINYQADIIFIGYFLTATDVGYYSVAIGLSKFFWIIPQTIQTITYPATSEYWANNNQSALQIMIDKSMKYSTCILLPIGLMVWLFAEEIIILIFGDSFIYAVLSLQILLIGTVINGVLERSIGGTLAGIGKAYLVPKIAACSATINIILNFILIPVFGISGAAIATAFSISITSIINLFFISKYAHIKIDIIWYEKAGLFALLALLICYIFNYNIIARILSIIFLIILIRLYLFKEMSNLHS